MILYDVTEGRKYADTINNQLILHNSQITSTCHKMQFRSDQLQSTNFILFNRKLKLACWAMKTTSYVVSSNVLEWRDIKLRYVNGLLRETMLLNVLKILRFYCKRRCCKGEIVTMPSLIKSSKFIIHFSKKTKMFSCISLRYCSQSTSNFFVY